MTDNLQPLREEYTAALQEYLAHPQEAGLMRVYDLGRRALALEVGVTELGAIHGQALSAALANARTVSARTRITQRAAELLGETMAPFEMMLRGYKEANTLLHQLNETLEQRVEERATALRESEDRFRLVAESIPSFIWTAAPDGTITYSNDHWYRYCGLTPEENAQDWPRRVLHPDDYDRCVADWARAVAEGCEYEIEIRNRRHDGTYRWFVTRAVPHKDEAGQVLSWFGVTTDVHELKELQAALKEADRRKDEFLAMLAHELRNPLAPIRNALQIIRLASNEPAEIMDSVDMMERQVQNFVRLIDDLMDVSRITRSKIELRKERLDLATVVQRAIEISRPHIKTGGHELTVLLPPRPIILHADAARLAQVVANLLNNATKYTEEGGRIWLTVECVEEHTVIRVRDTGIGIPVERLPDVFDMFVQLPSALDRAQGGVGVGLTLVKRLVEMHGGTVEAFSGGPGQGSEFVVRLPLAADDPTMAELSAPTTEDKTPNGTGGLRILVVDDHEDAAKSLGRLLKLAGHSVCIAHDGPAALEMATTFRPRIMLQDLAMPGMSGFEVARRIRARPEMENVLLVALTGYGSDDDRRRSRKAGFDHHLVKPVDFNALRQLLSSLE